MPSRATCRRADAVAQIAAQRDVIARLEADLWDGGFHEALLPSYQAAWRRLETLIAANGEDRRHRFVLAIPVADSPQQLKACLESLLELCRVFGYGGFRDGHYQKVSVIIADDTQDPELIGAHQAIAQAFDGLGIATTYFGLVEQLALVDTLADAASLARILGEAPREAFAHKGQAMMRNLVYLKLAQIHASDQPVLFHTLDADQQFKVKVAAANGDRNVCAVNFLAELDAIFSATDASVLTGKIVGDPPVSPAVMAVNFLHDVSGFLQTMAASQAELPYRTPGTGPHDGDAAYHDMAELFGFRHADETYPYRYTRGGSPSNADCLADFAARLQRFLHGEHPTRVTYYRYQAAHTSVQPARTVYTGNYVFRPEAINWFIPFAPLRLRMSGPTLGRLMKAELGARFVSANLPMLHTRTLDKTAAAEFRPGVVVTHDAIDLGDECMRQFYGDVMLFSVEQLTALGYPQAELSDARIAATLDAVHDDMTLKYASLHTKTGEILDSLSELLHDPAHWWHDAAHTDALAQFRTFLANMQRNFGADAACHARITAANNWLHWRTRLLDALGHYHADRYAWNRALAALQLDQP